MCQVVVLHFLTTKDAEGKQELRHEFSHPELVEQRNR